MSLSEQELRALQEIERSLLEGDPNFGSDVSEGSSFGSGSGAVTLRGVALVVVGLVMLIGGVALAQQSLWFVTLSIVGFLVMFGAGVWMLRGGGSVKSPIPSKASRSPKKAAPKNNGVGSRLEDNFRRRFEGN